eukprot:749584_1
MIMNITDKSYTHYDTHLRWMVCLEPHTMPRYYVQIFKDGNECTITTKHQRVTNTPHTWNKRNKFMHNTQGNPIRKHLNVQDRNFPQNPTLNGNLEIRMDNSDCKWEPM